MQRLASQSKMAARASVRAPACLFSRACHPDTEGGAHSSTWALICHREGGGGGVGAAASSRLQRLASQSKMAARAPRPCTSVPLQSRLPPRYRGRGALFGLSCYLPPGGRPWRCRGGGELPVANTRLPFQDGGSRSAPLRAPACLSSPACHPDTEGGAHSSAWAVICHREGSGRRCRGGGALPRLQILASQSNTIAHTPSRALVCHLGHVCCPCSVLTRYRERRDDNNP